MMQTFIALLRGINVSGQKKIKMEALRKGFEGLDCTNTRTYIQSGNVVFESGENNTMELARSIERMITENFDFNIPVLLLTSSELKQLLEQNPFLDKRKDELEKLYVTLLSTRPSPELLEKLKETTHAPDEFLVKDRLIYLYCPNGAGRTKLTNNFFEKRLGVDATSRNWRTLQNLWTMSMLSS